MKLSKKYENTIFAILMSLLMTSFMSGYMILINVGLPGNFIVIWLKSWALAVIAAFPVSLFFKTLLKKFIPRIIKKD